MKQSENPPVTLQMLADRLGLSRSTISRALHNHPKLSQATIQKVQALAKELDYRTDPEVNRLMVHLRHRKKMSSRPTVALVINQKIPFDLTGPESGQSVLVGAVERIQECGYQPEVFNLHEFKEKNLRLDKVLYSRGIQGVIICPFEFPGPLPELNLEHFSVVLIGHSIRAEHLHRVVTNQYQGMRDCIKELASRGYQRVGLTLDFHTNGRTNGFYTAAYFLEKELRPEMEFLPIHTFDYFSPESWLSGFRKWYKKHRPDAVIGVQAYLRHLQPWLEKQKLSIPDEFGMVALHLDPTNTSFSGILQNSLLVGRAASNTLVGLIQNYEIGIPNPAHMILVEGKWYEGSSLRPGRKKVSEG